MRRVAVALILPLPALAHAEPRAEVKPAEAITTRMEGPKRDLDEIERLIRDHYPRGHELGDGELFRGVLHDKWKFFALDAAGHLEETDRATYISWFRPDRIDKRLTWTTEIDFIDVYRDLASVIGQIESPIG
jgi:hypothetical protein